MTTHQKTRLKRRWKQFCYLLMYAPSDRRMNRAYRRLMASYHIHGNDPT